MAIAFLKKPKGSIVGTGQYVFRHYGDEGPSTYTVTYSGLDSSEKYFTYNGSKKTGSGTITINAGDTLALYGKATRNAGAQGDGNAAVYIRERTGTGSYSTIAQKVVYVTIGTNSAVLNYNYTPTSDITLQGGYSTSTINMYITRNV